jgi:DNA-binding transcriptional ArsR family regulator
MVSSNTPDYEISDTVEVSTPEQLRAIVDPLRMTLLDLVLERAATVTELAEAVGRPKSSVAYHVNVLVEAGLLRVVRTRKVRAIEERFYGRTGRTIDNAVHRRPGDTDVPMCVNELTVAATESVPAHEADTLCSTIRRVRVPRGKAMEFWRRVEELTREFAQLPREGDTVYAFVAGIYPTDHPTLPDPEAGPHTPPLAR